MPSEKETDKQQRMVDLLEELLRWTRAASSLQVREVLCDSLGTDEQKIAYHLSDGRRTCREVAKLAGCDSSTVAKWWKAWFGASIAEPVSAPRGKRARSLFALGQFGVRVPKLKKSREGNEKTSQSDLEAGKVKSSAASAEQPDSPQKAQT